MLWFLVTKLMSRLPYWKKPFKNKVFCKAENICDQKKCVHKLTAWEKNTLSKMHSDQLIVYEMFPECEKWNDVVEAASTRMKRLEMAQVRFENES